MKKNSFAVVLEQGPRSYMEDRCFLDLDFNKVNWIFGGVYDGHSGEAMAKHAAQNLHRRFLECLEKSNPNEAFITAYQMISDEIEDNSGACAANFFIQNNEIFHANVGDARIIIVREPCQLTPDYFKDGAKVDKDEIQLTTDHRVDKETEKKRIERMGGVIVYPYVYRGYDGLMPTRTLGDHYFKKVGIIATPSVGSYKILAGDKFLIAATDGLFDYLSNQEIGNLARAGKHPKEIAQALKKEILVNRRGDDNLTIIVLEFE